MNIIKREKPLSLFEQMHRELDDLFGFPFGARGLDILESDFASPKVDVSEDEKNIYVDADLPGMEEKDISVTLKNDLLRIEAKHESRKEEKKKNYHRVERMQRSFARNIYINSTVDQKSARGEYKNGVLKLVLPKTAEKEDEHQIKLN